jgi:hypothetical protein
MLMSCQIFNVYKLSKVMKNQHINLLFFGPFQDFINHPVIKSFL